MSSTHWIFLNSNDAINSNKPSEANWHLTHQNNLGNENFLLHIDEVQLPNAVYVVNSNYDSFSITDTGGTDTITLTHQNYTGAQLATELQTQLNASGTLNGTFTVTYDSQTLKITIASTVAYVINSGNVLDIVGYTVLPTTSGTSTTGDSPVRLDGTAYVDLITSLGKSSYSSRNITNTFFRICLNADVGSMVYYTPKTQHGIKLNSPDLTSFSIRLIDDKGNLYDLPPNCDISLTLRLESI